MMYPNAILVTINASETSDFVCFQTFDRRRRKSDRFFISKENLCRILCGSTDETIERDICSFVRIRPDGENIRFSFNWLRIDSLMNITGYAQSLSIPREVIDKAVDGESSQKVMILDPNAIRKAKVDIMPSAHKVIRNLDAAHRNALRKALRDSFNYGEASRVTLYGDGSRDFYFADSGIHGGLVCHTNRRGGKYYQIHT